MPSSRYRPDLMGTATLTPNGAFEAGSWQSFELTYVAGRFGLDDTGSLKIGFRFATDFGPLQFTDPQGPGYTTCEASNGASLSASWEFKRSIRPWSRSLYIVVTRGNLAPGDSILIRMGDRRFGSPGVRLQTYCENAFEFHVLADPFATYDHIALPVCPTIEIVAGAPVAWRAVLPTMVRAGTPFSLAIKAEDLWGNPTDRVDGVLRLSTSGTVQGLPATVTAEPGRFATFVEGLSAETVGDVVLEVSDSNGAMLCRSNLLRVVASTEDLVHFWGDTHGQSNETLGTNTAREYFEFGRDRAFLDVMGHQGNDFQISNAFWDDLNALTKEFDRPGEFVCIPGYEWSANTALGGDRNVHYRHEGEAIVRSSHAQIEDEAGPPGDEDDAYTADVLFETLAGRDCVVVAHVGGRYADIGFAHDGRLERSIEIHSSWGTFEWLLHQAFELDFRVGIVANSDGHKGRPGACFPGASFFGGQGGLTCFLAPRLDRDAIFESMRCRRHYGTTGERIVLSVEVLAQGAVRYSEDPRLGPAAEHAARRLVMGDIASTGDDEVELAIEVACGSPIEKVDIFDGMDLLETVRPYDETSLGSRVRLVYEGAESHGRDRATLWEGIVSAQDAVIERSAIFNHWNHDRGIVAGDERSVRWSAITTGNYGGIDLYLRNAGEAAVAFETAHVCGKASVGDLGCGEAIFDAGGVGRRIMLQRLPEAMTTCTMNIRRKARIRPRGDTRIYVRVQLENGHRAWSSPIYIFPGDRSSPVPTNS